MNKTKGIVDKNSLKMIPVNMHEYHLNAIDVLRETVIELRNPFKRSILDKIYND